MQVLLDGEPVTRFRSGKVRALLAYLAVEAGRPHHRRALAGLLWPDLPERAAANNLRFALHDLRRTLGDLARSPGAHEPPFLLAAQHMLQFNAASDCWVDAHAFEAAISHRRSAVSDTPSAIERLESAASLYRGRLLEGLSLRDAAPFEEWALLRCEWFERQALQALYDLAALYAAQGEWERALACAGRQLERAPWREEAHAQAMRALAALGRRSEALQLYERCRSLLAQELGVEPGAETAALYVAIRDGALRPGTGPGAGPNSS